MPQVFAIGPYSDTDATALKQEFGATRLPNLAAIADLPADQRRDVVAVAFMGHEPFDGAVMDLGDHTLHADDLIAVRKRLFHQSYFSRRFWLMGRDCSLSSVSIRFPVAASMACTCALT